MKNELIAAHLTARLRRSHRSDFPTVINNFVSVIQEHAEIRSHLFMEFENISLTLRQLSYRVNQASATQIISTKLTCLFSAT